MTRLLTAVAMLTWGGLAAADPAPAPDLAVPRCAAAPRLDGRLDDACWASAACLTNLHLVGAPGAPAGQHAVRVTRDAAWLYVGFRVAQAVSERNPPTCRRHDDDIQREDNVQVSFDPGTGGALYYQFLVSPANVRADFRMTRAGGRDREGWNAPWRSATAADDAGWTAELALPLAFLKGDGDPARARFNALVTACVVLRDACAAQVGVRREDWSWAPLQRQFDEPETFGRVLGLEAAACQPAFLPFVTRAAVGPYRAADDRFWYDVRADLQEWGGVGGDIGLHLEDQPVQGAGHTVTQDLALAAGATRSVSLAVPVDLLGARTAVLRLVDAAGEIRLLIPLDDTAALDVLSVFLDRNYYTAEPEAGAVCRLGLPATDLEALVLRVRTDGGDTLAEARAPRPDTTLALPLAGLAPGAHALAIEVCRPAGAPLARQSVTLTKRAPRPGIEWKIDQIHRVLLRDGNPFFPFGFVMYGIGAGDDWAFRDAAALGANSVIHWKASGGTNAQEVAADARAYLAAAARHGLAVIAVPDHDSAPVTLDDLEPTLPSEAFARLQALVATPRGRDLTRLRTSLVTDPILNSLPVAAKARVFFRAYEQQRPLFLAVAEAVKSAPNLIGYQPFDEPNLPALNQDDAGRDYYEHLHAVDGYHPVFVLYNTLWDGGDFRKRTTSWCDVLVQDPYWVPGHAARATKSGVNHVAGMVARTKRLADSARRVTMTVPLAEFFRVPRALLPAEQRCQTYLALIHGSKGLFCFSYPLVHQAMAETLAQLAREVRALAPACLAPDIAQEVRYAPGVFDPWRGAFPDVQVDLRRYPDGTDVLLAANTAADPRDVSFALSILGTTGHVARVFGPETCPVDAGAFRDRIEGLGTRAYRMPDRPAAEGTNAVVAIRVTIAAPSRAAAPPAEDADSPPATRKNLMPNSSFEEAALPGWPDYYRGAGAPLRPAQRIGAPAPVWGADTNQPYHGRSCLRMAGGSALRQVYLEYAIDPALTPQARPFVFSAWMRASRAEVNAALYVVQGAPAMKPVALTTDWQRYILPVTLPAGTGYLVLRWVQDRNQEGDTIWIDAAQLEAGEQATAYEP